MVLLCLQGSASIQSDIEHDITNRRISYVNCCHFYCLRMPPLSLSLHISLWFNCFFISRWTVIIIHAHFLRVWQWFSAHKRSSDDFIMQEFEQSRREKLNETKKEKERARERAMGVGGRDGVEWMWLWKCAKQHTITYVVEVWDKHTHTHVTSHRVTSHVRYVRSYECIYVKPKVRISVWW